MQKNGHIAQLIMILNAVSVYMFVLLPCSALDIVPNVQKDAQKYFILLNQGSSEQIRLQFNAGTAFKWQCLTKDDIVAELNDLGIDREDKKEPNFVGFSQSHNYLVTAKSPGASVINCKFTRFDLLYYQANIYLTVN